VDESAMDAAAGSDQVTARVSGLDRTADSVALRFV